MIADGRSHDPFEIVGVSKGLQASVELAERYARSSLPVLIVGPSGAGKELIARHVHRRSGRTGAFVDLNCGAVPVELFEGTLFGRRKGAFTGAHDSQRGLVEEAGGGSLFLDELGSLPAGAQAKLLRVLESGQVRRVGDVRPRSVDFRPISAAQCGVWDRVTDGELRHDLLQRIAGVVIVVPGLEDRPDDIGPLANHFATRVGATLERDALRVLEERSWPGNVRELRAAVERAATFATEGRVSASAIVEAVDHGPARFLSGLSRRPAPALEAARAALEEVCEECDWDAEEIARHLGVGRTTVFRRLKRVGLSLRRPA